MSAGFDPSSGYGEDEGGGLPAFLLDPVGVLHRRWLPMAICLALGVLVTIVAVIVWKPEYVATATMLITSQQIPKDFVRSTVEEDSLANISGMIGEVLSAESLSDLIDHNKLFPDAGAKVPRIDLINRIRSRVTAAPSNRPGGGAASLVYEISYRSRDPQEAAVVSNAVAAKFVDVSMERRNSQARRTTVFLRSAMERTEKELREQASKITEFRQAHRGDLPEEMETSLRRLDMLGSQRESLSQQITGKEDRLLSISSRGSETSENEVLIGDLRRQLAREIAIHTDEHPNVIALRERLVRLEETNRKSPLPLATTHMIEDERREVARLRDQRDRIDAMITDLNQHVDRIPRVSDELAALQQREVVLRDDYTGAMRKVEAAELAENLESAKQGGQVSLLDSALPPTSPKLPRSLVGLAGLVASIGLALAVAVLLELIDPVVISAGQITSISDRPVLGTVPLVV